MSADGRAAGTVAAGTVRVALARCGDDGGPADHTAVWRCVGDDADTGPRCEVQPAHTATQTIAAARRIRRG